MSLRRFLSNTLFDINEYSNHLFSTNISTPTRQTVAQEEMGSMCQRLCQLPQLLVGLNANGELEENTFQPLDASDSGTGSGNLNIITPLQRQQLEEENYLSHKYLVQELPSKNKNTNGLGMGAMIKSKSRDNMTYADPEAGKQCEICNSHDKTHYAIPCGHSACLTCWSRWLYSNKNPAIESSESEKKNPYHSSCMVCARNIKRIRRYSFSLVPQRAYENKVMEFTAKELADLAASLSFREKSVSKTRNVANIESLQIAIDDSLERVIRSLLDVKDALDNEIVSKLITVEKHLYQLTRPEAGTTMDALASILAVECLTVGEVFQAYKKVFKDEDSISKWKAIELELAKLHSAINRAGSFLDLAETVEVLNSDGPASEQFKNDLKNLEETLSVVVSPTSITVQWNQIKELLHKASGNHHLVPGILRVFGLINTSTLLDISDTFEIIETAEKAKEKLDNRFGKLLEEDLPLLVSRINSAYSASHTNGEKQTSEYDSEKIIET
mmetsp:Transcript_5680/g.6513  ORF Transcript_5680/g.6513 Transcript_5680/m.6513 type:complete len:500 (+) Transcript_5680:170-1669(+)